MRKFSASTTTSTKLQLSWLLSLLLALATNTMVFASIDPGDDFGGYVEELQRREWEDRAYEAKLNAHEEWRQTTWTGTAVRKVQGIAQHFEPFLLAVHEALDQTTAEDGTKSLGQIAAYIGIRLLFVMCLLTVFYVGGKVVQLVVGGDIEIVEEVVIVHEHETEEEAAKARASTTRGKRKKQKDA